MLFLFQGLTPVVVRRFARASRRVIAKRRETSSRAVERGAMAGLVAARAPWREDRSPSHLSDSTRVSSDPPAAHPAARDDDADDDPPSFPRLKICSRRCG